MTTVVGQRQAPDRNSSQTLRLTSVTRTALLVVSAVSRTLAPAVIVAVGVISFPTTAAPYENGFPSDGAFFPIGVWEQSPENVTRFKAIGVNTYVGLWEGPNEAQLAELVKHDIYVIAEQNDVGLASVNRGIIRGWIQPDEPDNAQSRGLGIYGPCIPAADVARRSKDMKARDATRPVMINFGPGVADPLWRGRGVCAGDVSYYDAAIQGADIIGFDIYPVGSDIANVKGKLEYVAQGVVNLVKRATPGQTVWTAIETTALDPARPVKPHEVRTEVWMALIHGARGICYFVHEWANGFREDGIFRHPEVVEEVTKINRTITALAPVLNGRDMTGEVSVASPVPISVMAKEREQALYIFAVAMRNEKTVARFTAQGIDGAEVSVLEEDRKITARDGIFEDAFEGYGVHLYKITPR